MVYLVYFAYSMIQLWIFSYIRLLFNLRSEVLLAYYGLLVVELSFLLQI